MACCTNVAALVCAVTSVLSPLYTMAEVAALLSRPSTVAKATVCLLLSIMAWVTMLI